MQFNQSIRLAMETQIEQVNRLFTVYFQEGRNVQETTLVARQISLTSEREDFLEVAMLMLSSYEQLALSRQKITLLCCMLKDKFKYCYEGINTDKLQMYYNGLIHVAKHMGVEHRGIFYNIAESLAIIFIHSLGTQSFNMEQYLSFCEAVEHPIELGQYYFKILDYCVSDITSSRIVMDSFDRKNSRSKLAESQLEVIVALNEKAKAMWLIPDFNKKPIVDCFTSWIDIKYNKEVLNSLHQLELFGLIIELVRDPVYYEEAAECLKVVTQGLCNSSDNSSIYLYLLQLMSELILIINESLLQRQLDMASEQMQLVIAFCSKFIETLLATYTPQLREMLILPLIKFFYTNLEDVVDYLLDFTRDFLCCILDSFKSKPMSNDFRMEIPLAILGALLDVCRYPSVLIDRLDVFQEHKLSNHYEEADQIYRNRIDSMPCFEQIAQLLGIEIYLHYLVDFISKSNYGSEGFFGELEVYLYALYIPLDILETVNEDVIMLVTLYEQLVEAQENRKIPVIVNRTFLRLFKSVLRIKGQDPQLTRKLISFISQNLNQPLLFDIARRAFSTGCLEHPKLLHENIEDLKNLAMSYLEDEHIQRGLISVACADKSTAHHYISDLLLSLHQVCIDQLSADQKQKDCLKCLSQVFKTLKRYKFDHSMLIFKKYLYYAWEFLIETLQHPSSKSEDEDAQVERITRIFKNIMRLLGPAFQEFVPALFRAVNETFNQYPICSYVYLVQIAITVFSKTEQGLDLLQPIYQTFTSIAFSHLDSADSINRLSYLVDDFLGMNTRLMHYNTDIIINSMHFHTLLVFVSKKCLITAQTKVLAAASHFLNTLLMMFWSPHFIAYYQKHAEDEEVIPQLDYYLRQQLRGHVLEQAKDIIEYMFEHLTDSPSSSTQNRILDVLLALVKAFPQHNLALWKNIIVNLPLDVLVSSEKSYLLQLFQELGQQDQAEEANPTGVSSSTTNHPAQDSLNHPFFKTAHEINNSLQTIGQRMHLAAKRRHLELTYK